VTHAQWKAIMGTDLAEQVRRALVDDTLYTLSGKQTTIRAHLGAKKDDDPAKLLCNTDDSVPMYYISWYDAMEFCHRLTEIERAADRLPEGYEYTLPTEAQWEYACRAGQPRQRTRGRCAFWENSMRRSLTALPGTAATAASGTRAMD